MVVAEAEGGAAEVLEAAVERLHELLPLGSVGIAVGGHEPLIELPRDLDRAMPFVGEQRVQSRALPFGEEAHPGVQVAAGAVERIALAATMPVAGKWWGGLRV